MIHLAGTQNFPKNQYSLAPDTHTYVKYKKKKKKLEKPLDRSGFQDMWDKVFKNGPSKTCGRQSLKNFTWSIFKYFILGVFLFYVFYYSSLELRRKL